MIKLADLNGLSAQELQVKLEDDIQRYALEINELVDEEELINREQELIAVMQENDQIIKSIEYDLPDSCMFDGQSFSKKTIGEYIADFVCSQEVEWGPSLGMYEMVKLWKNKDIEKITYSAYDSTLRVLGALKYKGFESWKRILAINSYLTSCHDAYVKDTTYMIYLSQLHNTILDALKKYNPEEVSDTEAREN